MNPGLTTGSTQVEPVVNDNNDNESQRILANPGEDIEFANLSSIAHLRKGELPRWGKGRGKPLPRESGKEGLEDAGQIAL